MSSKVDVIVTDETDSVHGETDSGAQIIDFKLIGYTDESRLGNVIEHASLSTIAYEG